ncbi:MAG: amidophosphoribosyltransferase [Bacteroidetes bacterium]|nr:amidophosphoribosyltransferase [Bacteroidota bacterium]MBT4398927.1 amidophosphoribosyltransferase [Bacteroidota bacterium]MBT4410093.1 amidophosphoribosyltransferase [Bacteroidota bacterium]MBT7095622.1 amidophosphoribosyltransferase [Bacteroidota bacterium]MBT7463606.1 amidophosphoribosyltransferase [Bacteroidota bacterium]
MSGFFGAISQKDVVTDVFYGTDYHSHLGTKRAGMAFLNKGDFSRSIHSLENAYFRNKFENALNDFKGNSGVGVISDTDSQPILVNSHLGKFALVTVSKINNSEELTKHFLDKGMQFVETSQNFTNPTELVAKLICEEDNFVSGIENVHNSIKGSCSLLILNDEGIIAARDKLGRTTITLGKNHLGYALASETCSFPNLAYETEHFIGAGEIIKVTADGYEVLKKASDKMQVCSFLWVYYGYPNSDYENINVDQCRYNCGAALAKRDSVDADFVCGIPDSGVGHAYGYSNERKLPYKRAYTKYTPTWPRSFMPQSQETRDLVARMKLIPNKDLVKGQKMVFLDDSIVRGTQLKDNTKDLYDCGASEVHMRIACPPLTFPCMFLNFSQSRSTLELATRKAIKILEGDESNFENYTDPTSANYVAMVDQIAKTLGLDSLMYQDLPDLVEAIGLPKEQLCTHCWDGSSYF